MFSLIVTQRTNLAMTPIRSEHVGKVFEKGGRPDILIGKSDGWPVVLEAEPPRFFSQHCPCSSRIGLRGLHWLCVQYQLLLVLHSQQSIPQQLHAVFVECHLL